MTVQSLHGGGFYTPRTERGTAMGGEATRKRAETRGGEASLEKTLEALIPSLLAFLSSPLLSSRILLAFLRFRNLRLRLASRWRRGRPCRPICRKGPPSPSRLRWKPCSIGGSSSIPPGSRCLPSPMGISASRP